MYESFSRSIGEILPYYYLHLSPMSTFLLRIGNGALMILSVKVVRQGLNVVGNTKDVIHARHRKGLDLLPSGLSSTTLYNIFKRCAIRARDSPILVIRTLLIS